MDLNFTADDKLFLLMSGGPDTDLHASTRKMGGTREASAHLCPERAHVVGLPREAVREKCERTFAFPVFA